MGNGGVDIAKTLACNWVSLDYFARYCRPIPGETVWRPLVILVTTHQPPLVEDGVASLDYNMVLLLEKHWLYCADEDAVHVLHRLGLDCKMNPNPSRVDLLLVVRNGGEALVYLMGGERKKK
jgi:hypothetical protein